MFETRIDELKLETEQAYLLLAESLLQPHVRYDTKVVRHPDGRSWLCVPEYVEDFRNHPYGTGPTPEQACASFDRAWTGEGCSPVDRGTCVETLQKHKDCGRKLSPLEGWLVEFLIKTIEEFE